MECRGPNYQAVHRCHRCTICCDNQALDQLQGVNLVSKSADPLTGTGGFEFLLLQQRVVFAGAYLRGSKNPGFRAVVPGCVPGAVRQRAQGAANIAPTRSNISVGPYFQYRIFWRCGSRQVIGLKSQGRSQTRSGFPPGSEMRWILRVGIGLKAKSRARSADRAKRSGRTECASSFLGRQIAGWRPNRESLGWMSGADS